MRRFLRHALRLAGAIAAGLLIYLVAALVFALVPEGGRLQAATEGLAPVIVCADAVHSDILISVRDTSFDWQGKLDFGPIKETHPEAYAAIGWGDLVFFREVPSWGDVRFKTVAAALAGMHPTALRVLFVGQPQEDKGCVSIRIDADGRRALAQYILETIEPGGGPPTGAGPYEIYYPAAGRYGPLHTCNQWVADGLAAAGLPHSRFSPFSFGVMWPLRE